MQVGRKMRWGAVLAAGLVAAAGATEPPGDVPRRVASNGWPVAYGSQRAVVRVTHTQDAVRVTIPWRRHDPAPESKGVVIRDALGNRLVSNLVVAASDAAAGEVIFDPEYGPGDYHVYYTPCSWSGGMGQPVVVDCVAPDGNADSAWMQRHALAPAQRAANRWLNLPPADLLGIEARTEFERADPMEVIATPDEVRDLRDRFPEREYLLFPEDRAYPIRMRDTLPWRWVERGPQETIRGQTACGEFYAFQLGVWAARAPLQDVRLVWRDLVAADGARIPAARIRCLNGGGVDYRGAAFTNVVNVDAGRIQALWCGVEVPADIAPGTYAGRARLEARDRATTELMVELEVTAERLPDDGDKDLWRMARLRWLDSTIGLEPSVPAPFTPLQVDGTRIRCWGREVVLDPSGLPAAIRSAGRDILAGPVTVELDLDSGPVRFAPSRFEWAQTGPDRVVWTSAQTVGSLVMRGSAKMEFDGYLEFAFVVHTYQPLHVKDVRLRVPYARDVARYAMGLGRRGGARPAEWTWKWETYQNNMLWMGDYDAGLHCRLIAFYLPTDLPTPLGLGHRHAWYNDGRGNAVVREEGTDQVVLEARSGPQDWRLGEVSAFRWAFLVTPAKLPDPGRWQQRYYHRDGTPEDARSKGATIMNLHHGSAALPYINYPFLQEESLARRAADARALGLKTKVYYTVRELSSHAAELFALRSLGEEILRDGPGGGSPWLREHLVTNYWPAWQQLLPDRDLDGSLGVQGRSRWSNYYLEGARRLLATVGLDGFYLDQSDLDRTVMQRLWRVVQDTKPEALLDLHVGDDFKLLDTRVSPASKFMEFFPYLNSLWFGENFDYNQGPDFWLVEVSGLPFGLHGDMLAGGGNPWRGMIYGMTARYYTPGPEPRYLWEFWDRAELADKRMLGYWNPDCPVRPDQESLRATAYVGSNQTVVALASWAPGRVNTRLAIDWPALGLDPEHARLYAPMIPFFQEEALFSPTGSIPVNAGQGWLFLLDEFSGPALPTNKEYAGLSVRWDERFAGERLEPAWQVAGSDPSNRLAIRDGALHLQARNNTALFIERPLAPGTALLETRIHTGSDGGVGWGLGLGAAWPHGFLRIAAGAHGKFLVDDGHNQFSGGACRTNTAYFLRMRMCPAEIVLEYSEDGRQWCGAWGFSRFKYPGAPLLVRVGKMSNRGRCESFKDPGAQGNCSVLWVRAWGADPTAGALEPEETWPPRPVRWWWQKRTAAHGTGAGSRLGIQPAKVGARGGN